MRVIIYDIPEQDIKNSKYKDSVLINAREINHYCIGCFGCWLKTPGTCIIQDQFKDMGKLLSEAKELLVITKATFGSYSSCVKNVFDRSISYVLPFFEIRNNEMHHGERYFNDLTINAIFYGDITEEEKITSRDIVKANAINLNAHLGNVVFVEHMEDVL